ncbi:MAG: hypothetical protein N2749_05305 [Clostridia bacterium]|nr:hypothetical protein [Clostridia bacterium]
MYEDLAWDNFLKTGNLESFLEYKKMADIKDNIESTVNGFVETDEVIEGVLLNETSQSKRDSDKGNTI